MSFEHEESHLEPVNPESLGRPSGYSQGMLAQAEGEILFIAGQVAWDENQELVCEDFRGQFAQAMANVLTVVRAAGGKHLDLAQLTIFVVDRHEYLACRKELAQAYRLVMGRHFPAMTLVEVSALLEPGAKVEIQGIAVITPKEEATRESTGTFSVTQFSRALAGRRRR